MLHYNPVYLYIQPLYFIFPSSIYKTKTIRISEMAKKRHLQLKALVRIPGNIMMSNNTWNISLSISYNTIQISIKNMTSVKKYKRKQVTAAIKKIKIYVYFGTGGIL